MHEICTDLTAEREELRSVLTPLSPEQWDLPTPSPGWSIRDQVSHLWFFDQRALLALTDPNAFIADMEALMASGTDASVETGRTMEPSELLEQWQRDGRRLMEVAASLDPSTRVVWYGPSMAARSFITARLMETWAHGQDVVDALGVVRAPTDRLRHVAHLGVRTRPFSYALRGMPVPAEDVAVRLIGPRGDEWTWGPDGAVANVIAGTALDFCLVVTQRRNVADTLLDVRGPAATEWMSIAQAYAGGAGTGRQPGEFPVTDQ
jgi:uncharacterized protein (TIGR03084 family)